MKKEKREKSFSSLTIMSNIKFLMYTNIVLEQKKNIFLKTKQCEIFK